MIRVVLVDDHELTRRGIAQVLAEDPEFLIVGEADNGFHGWELICTLKPDVALLDVRMPGLPGPAICQRVKAQGLATVCIILTSYTDEALLQSALTNGARGYIIKDVSGSELKHSIRQIAAGGAVLDPRATAQVVRWLETGEVHALRLSSQDVEILALVAQGWTNREIADRLHFSENTVKAHVNQIMAQLGAKNRVEAAVIAYRHGLI
ncbi:MAG: response regulator transcription factor [Firmicutes bacterium]|nr:response regulator transcription factor [Bacillota bacterium]